MPSFKYVITSMVNCYVIKYFYASELNKPERMYAKILHGPLRLVYFCMKIAC
jgi:hypothetical protein